MAIRIMRGTEDKIAKSSASLRPGQLLVDDTGMMRVNPEQSSGRDMLLKSSVPVTGIGAQGAKTRCSTEFPKLYKHNITIAVAGELEAKATFYSIWPEPFISSTTTRVAETATAKGYCGAYAQSGAIIGVMLRATGYVDSLQQSAAGIVLNGRVEGFRFLVDSTSVAGVEVLFTANKLTLSDSGTAQLDKAISYLRYYLDTDIIISDEVEVPMLRSMNDIKVGDCIHFQSAMTDSVTTAGENLIFRHVSRNHTYGSGKYDVWQAARCLSKTSMIDNTSYVNYMGYTTNYSPVNQLKQKLDAATFLPSWIPVKTVSVKAACGTNHNAEPYVLESVNCKLFPAAIEEIYGSGYSYAVAGEGTQFDYYKQLKVTTSKYNGVCFYGHTGKAGWKLSSYVNKNQTSNSSTYSNGYPWARSLFSDDSDGWCCVGSSGSPYSDGVGVDGGVAPCFCI